MASESCCNYPLRKGYLNINGGATQVSAGRQITHFNRRCLYVSLKAFYVLIAKTSLLVFFYSISSYGDFYFFSFKLLHVHCICMSALHCPQEAKAHIPGATQMSIELKQEKKIGENSFIFLHFMHVITFFL